MKKIVAVSLLMVTQLAAGAGLSGGRATEAPKGRGMKESARHKDAEGVRGEKSGREETRRIVEGRVEALQSRDAHSVKRSEDLKQDALIKEFKDVELIRTTLRDARAESREEAAAADRLERTIREKQAEELAAAHAGRPADANVIARGKLASAALQLYASFRRLGLVAKEQGAPALAEFAAVITGEGVPYTLEAMQNLTAVIINTANLLGMKAILTYKAAFMKAAEVVGVAKDKLQAMRLFEACHA